MDKANSYAPCILDVDIEKGKPESEKPKSIGECVVNLKHDDYLTREFLTELISQIRGKFMQPLMNHRPEIVYDTPTNRSRKYKRSVPFNSRRVALLFSVLSSVGTMILIYLTLRLRPIGDVSGNI
ncbi:hypothetical protein Adt_20179 [Abeliophyllum distichum]|uniref:Uncharacterized protein n=1 Tax=Abeliophyllum distichum TaxID=126358 RepID=A0ABD1SVU5_9LAMI